MTNKQIDLVAPNSLPIVGIRLKDGTIRDFEYSYDSANLVRSFILKDGGGVKMLERDADLVLVDSDGNDWPALDIEYDSISKS